MCVTCVYLTWSGEKIVIWYYKLNACLSSLQCCVLAFFLSKWMKTMAHLNIIDSSSSRNLEPRNTQQIGLLDLELYRTGNTQWIGFLELELYKNRISNRVTMKPPRCVLHHIKATSLWVLYNFTSLFSLFDNIPQICIFILTCENYKQEHRQVPPSTLKLWLHMQSVFSSWDRDGRERFIAFSKG